MINIHNKQDCCGCHACASVCLKQCIMMQEDNEGFLYPIVDIDTCIECGLCEKICPVINHAESRKPLKVYAAKNKDEEIRKQSSSGGVFTLLAEAIIKEGGVVFGAKFDKDWNVVHDWTDTIEGIAAFRGSKYVQSTIGDTYRQAREFLKQGRKVLFSGTPCQIKALKLYLRKEYETLVTVDVACHGVPSPLVWKMYLEDISKTACRAVKSESTELYSINAMSLIKDIKFREKFLGWRKFRIVLKIAEPNGEGDQSSELSFIHYENPYFNAFNRSLIIRPSCTECVAKHGKSNSDITIADFWGIENVAPQIDDDKGVSLILINTSIGKRLFELLDMDSLQCRYEDALMFNSGLRENTKYHSKRSVFFKNYMSNPDTTKYMSSLLKLSLLTKIISKIRKILK